MVRKHLEALHEQPDIKLVLVDSKMPVMDGMPL